MTDSPSSSPQREKKKRKQVRRACTNCRKAHSGCNEERPCSRCIKNGLEDSCMDVPRKPRASHKKRKSQEKDSDDFAPSRPVTHVKKRARRLRHSFDDSTGTGDEEDAVREQYADFDSSKYEAKRKAAQQGEIGVTRDAQSPDSRAAEAFGYINENVSELHRGHIAPRQNLQAPAKRRKPKNREHYQSMVSELYDLQRYNSQLENTLQGILLEIHQMTKEEPAAYGPPPPPPPPHGTAAWTHTTSTSQLYYPPPSPVASSAAFAASSSSPLLSSSYASTASATPSVIANLKQDPLLSSAVSSYSSPPLHSPPSSEPPSGAASVSTTTTMTAAPNVPSPPSPHALPPHNGAGGRYPHSSVHPMQHQRRFPQHHHHHAPFQEEPPHSIPQQQHQPQPQHHRFHRVEPSITTATPTISRGGGARSSRGSDASGTGSDKMRHPVY